MRAAERTAERSNILPFLRVIHNLLFCAIRCKCVSMQRDRRKKGATYYRERPVAPGDLFNNAAGRYSRIDIGGSIALARLAVFYAAPRARINSDKANLIFRRAITRRCSAVGRVYTRRCGNKTSEHISFLFGLSEIFYYIDITHKNVLLYINI